MLLFRVSSTVLFGVLGLSQKVVINLQHFQHFLELQFLGSNRAALHLPRVSGDVWRPWEAKGLPKYKILIFEIIGFRIKMCDDLEP